MPERRMLDAFIVYLAVADSSLEVSSIPAEVA
jgi:hypothetical protein